MSARTSFRTPVLNTGGNFPEVFAEREAARKRQGMRTDLQADFRETVPEVGRTRDKVAAYVGMSGRTLEKAQALMPVERVAWE